MAKNIHGTRSELIHCDNCGEDYSATYKRCPFCGARPDKTGYTQATGRFDLTGKIPGESRRTARPQEDAGRRGGSRVQDDDYVFDGGDVFDDDEDDDGGGYAGRKGGKHLADDGFGVSPTTVAGIVFSAVIVIAAILIVALVIVPMVRSGRTPTAENNPNTSLPGVPSESDLPSTDSPSQSSSVPPDDSPDDPDATASPSSAQPSPSVPVSTPPVSAGFTITYAGKTISDFTISDRHPDPVQLSTSGASGTVTWTSSNPGAATVSAGGKVTAVAKGSATITATDSAGRTQTCRVIVSITGGTAQPSPSASDSPSPSPSPSPSSSAPGSLSLNRTDITISDRYPNPVRLRASGASGTVDWSSSNPEVATVDENGLVTRVSKGTCTITAKDGDGNTASCIVRCGG